MQVYERHLAREIYGDVLLVMAAFLALFAFFDLIHELESVGKGGYELHHALAFVTLSLPGRAYEILPIAVLIGTLYGLTLLAHHSEITVLRASGLATGELLLTLAKIGSLFVVLTLLLGEIVAPQTERMARQLQLTAKSSVVGQAFRSGLWVKDGRSFINVREVLPDIRLRGIRIYSFDDEFRLRSISEAEEGSYLPSGQWRLDNVAQTLFEDEKASVVRQPTVDWQSALNPDILAVLLVQADRMSLVNLYQYIRHLSENRQKTERYEIALWKKLVYPLAALVMMALAVPFAYIHERTVAVSAKVFAGVMLGIVFYMLNGLFSHLGIINHWTPWVAAVAPSVMFLLAAAALLWWVERR
ncbi:LPS export ABC transporter permease LptG [Sulfuricystis multivorans]|uniref:LPS export ABC transporter permease LptG n=1 Tax=Sulfuricystis multivorans TaxID=2211108 RepID=UPI000F822696|nr:LPS export ABC transporter permease LptG [Sulfuricystis multivorans]